MTCKGICTRAEYHTIRPIGGGRYAAGQRRCQICDIFIKVDGLWCPCCGYRLRTKPRNLKYKSQLRTKKGLETFDKDTPNRKQMEFVDGNLVLTEISQDV